MLVRLLNQGHAYFSMTSKEARLSLALQEPNCSSTATTKVILTKMRKNKARTRLRKVFRKQEWATFGTLLGIVCMKGQWCVWMRTAANKPITNINMISTTNTHSQTNQHCHLYIETGGDAMVVRVRIKKSLCTWIIMKINYTSENHSSFSSRQKSTNKMVILIGACVYKVNQNRQEKSSLHKMDWPHQTPSPKLSSNKLNSYALLNK